MTYFTILKQLEYLNFYIRNKFNFYNEHEYSNVFIFVINLIYNEHEYKCLNANVFITVQYLPSFDTH